MDIFLVIVIIIIFIILINRIYDLKEVISRNSSYLEEISNHIKSLNEIIKEGQKDNFSDQKLSSKIINSDFKQVIPEQAIKEELENFESPSNIEDIQENLEIIQQDNEVEQLNKKEELGEEKEIEKGSLFDEFIISEEQTVISQAENIPIEESDKMEESIHMVLEEEKSIEKEKGQTNSFDLEKLFGENILSKAGIITLVLGIAYFIKYAIDKNWIGEAGRVAIGALVGLGIIGIAHRIRTKYKVFSALLVGGGISILYITVTFGYRDYALFSQSIAFATLIIITIFSVILSLYYNEKILAIFSILGGFSSPLLVSSGAGDYVTLSSYIFILNSGMLVLAYKKRWQEVSMLSYFLTYLFFIYWMSSSYEEINKVGAILFSILFFAQFYTLGLIEYFKTRKINQYQIFVLLSNNLILYFSLLFYFMNDPSNYNGIITFSMGIINAIPLLLLIRTKPRDEIFIYLLLGIVISFISLSIPIQLSGIATTMFWFAETILLLWLFKKIKNQILGYCFIILLVLSLCSFFNNFTNYYFNDEQDFPIILNPIFVTGVFATICLYIVLKMLGNQIEEIFIKKIDICKLEDLRIVLKYIIGIFIFIIPFSELSYQIQTILYREEINLILGAYIYLFVASFIIIMKNKAPQNFYYLYFILVLLYPIIYIGFIVHTAVMEQYLVYSLYEFNYLLYSIHFLTIPAFLILLDYLRKKDILSNPYSIYWINSVLLILTISLELDNIALMFYSQEVLVTVHTLFYSIAWGILAFIFMLIGIKKEKVIYRRISLVIFGLVIFKLYIYDIWEMSRIARVISFILLGVILLVASFLYQKLKILIQDKKQE